MLGKLLIWIMVLLTINSFSFSQVVVVTVDTSFEKQARDWYFTNIILDYPDISKNQLRQKAEKCLSGAFLFRNCEISRRAINSNIINDIGYLYTGGEIGINTRNMPDYFNYSEAWKKKQRRLEFLDGAFGGVIEALYYGFDY